VKVASFKQPTPEEMAHDFLWRVHPHAPAKGEISIFNRSHYEDVLVTRVHKLIPPEIWKPRFGIINNFEHLLAVENGTTILKFFLHISSDEQLARFKVRLDEPGHKWKISDSDYSERKLWDSYMEAFEEAISKTSTKEAPWFVIPSDRKWFRDIAIAHIIVGALEAMNLQTPSPSVNIEEIRKEYQNAEGSLSKIDRIEVDKLIHKKMDKGLNGNSGKEKKDS
jgi:PPK2 family polyphosphate:nucleotide phosphotransferase